MTLQHAGDRHRILIAVLAVIGGVLIGMAVGFLVGPGETKQATIARLW